MAKAISKSRETSAELGRADDAFANAVGRLLRSARAKRGMTRRQLAEQSGASERYLAQIESGQGNPSVIVLKSIAEALDVPMIELLAVADLIAGRADRTADRARRIALVGLRGAGKSTLGRKLAEHLGCPFIE